MKKLPALTKQLVAGIALLACLSAHAQPEVRQIQVPLIGQNCNARVPAVSHITGELRLPTATHMPVPAVLIMHSNAGIVGVGRHYAQALNGAGIATLEIDSYGPRHIRDGNDANAPTGCDRLNDAWSGLDHLSQMPNLDRKNIGILGLSSGGLVALMAAQGLLARGMTTAQGPAASNTHFRSAFVLYPACSNVLRDPKLSWMRQASAKRLAIDPKPAITLVVGTEDDFELNMQEDCTSVVQQLTAMGHPALLLTRSGATHAFDWPTPPPPSFNRFAKAGQGSLLTMRFSEKDRQQTQSDMIQFFTQRPSGTP